MRHRPISEQTHNDMCKIIPGGVNSPVRACIAMSQPPLVAASGSGDLIYDVDGHSYIDYCGSWGSLIHGHAHPQIITAIQKRAAQGTSFGITTAIEGELAQQIVNTIPSIKKIRFVSSGTEATMSAVRLARAFTGRDMIVKFNGNYHGHADFFLVQAGSGVFQLPESSSSGIPAEFVKYTISLPYNDIDACLSLFNNEPLQDRIAAVIIEPIAANMGVVPATQKFLQMIRDETRRIGALLILDEVITGYRVSHGGAQELYQITPDLTCLGKIIGGGFPAAAFGGRDDIMDCLAPLGPVYQAGTLSGNPIAMEAGVTALKMLERIHFYEELENKTNIITIPVREAIQKKKAKACVQQSGSMFTIFFGQTEVRSMEDAQKLDLKTFAHFFRFLFNKGIYIPPSQHEAWFVSMAHETAHLEKTRDVILEYIHQN